jgi:hypothetical protein
MYEINHNIKICNKSFENVSEWKYLVVTIINENYNCEEIKSKLNFGSACYHSVQNVLPPCHTNFICCFVRIWYLVSCQKERI